MAMTWKPVTLKLGKVKKTKARFKGDKLVHETADLLMGKEIIGSVHTGGYAPRWAFEINKYRWRPEHSDYVDSTADTRSPFFGLLADGAAFDTAELARQACERQLTRLEARKFIEFLSKTLVPDLRATGLDCTADDFDSAILFLWKI